MPINNAFSDQTPKNALIIPRGSFAFLVVALRASAGGPLVSPASDAFQQTSIRSIVDADSNDITSSWVTNTLDPADSNDTFDENHADYVGDVASPENTGLFAEGYNNGSGTPTGRIAQKIEVPDSAEITDGSNTRSYTISWSIKAQDGSTVTDSETFNVGAAGVLVFSTGLVTVEEVKAGLSTTLTDSEIQDIITEAELRTEGYLDACGIDTTAFTTLPALVRTSIIWGSRAIILQRDLGAGRSVESLREGNKSIRFSSGQSSENQAMMYWDFWERDLNRYCTVAGQGEHRLKSINKRGWHDVLGDSRFKYGTSNQRRRK